MSSDFHFSKKEWFFEAAFPGVRRCKRDGFLIQKEIYEGKSKYQHMYAFESPEFGRMLVLDGIIQFSQSDEFIYHEMIVHVPLLAHKNPRKFLLVGGGDGGVIREASKHPLSEIHMVEIDREIVEVCKKYFPFVSKGAFNDKRLRLCFEDGQNFIRRHPHYFDVIVVDSTDPVGPGKALFESPFYKNVHSALADGGIAIFQLGPFLDFDLIIKGIARGLKKMFRYVTPIRLPMPSYSCGSEYCFMMASKSVDPSRLTPAVIRTRQKVRLGARAASLKYITPEMFCASLVMPKMWQIDREK